MKIRQIIFDSLIIGIILWGVFFCFRHSHQTKLMVHMKDGGMFEIEKVDKDFWVEAPSKDWVQTWTPVEKSTENVVWYRKKMCQS